MHILKRTLHYCQIRDISNRLLECPQNVPKNVAKSPTSKVGHVGDIRRFYAWFVRDGICPNLVFCNFFFFLIFLSSNRNQTSSIQKNLFWIQDKAKWVVFHGKVSPHFSARDQCSSWWSIWEMWSWNVNCHSPCCQRPALQKIIRSFLGNDTVRRN